VVALLEEHHQQLHLLEVLLFLLMVEGEVVHLVRQTIRLEELEDLVVEFMEIELVLVVLLLVQIQMQVVQDL
jgi:hypothetical protein